MVAAVVMTVALWTPAVDTAIQWHPARTPWGDPDLQGRFTNERETAPMERAVRYGEREYLRNYELWARQAKRWLDSRQNGGVAGVEPGSQWFPQSTASRRTSLIVDPVDGRIPPLTPQGRERARTREASRSTVINSWLDRGRSERCITLGVPSAMLPRTLGSVYEIVQAPGYVAFRYELIHEARVIPLDDRRHVDGSIRLHLGDGHGRWDGDTLVVTTTNFNTYTNYGADPETLVVTERFRPVAAGALEWSVTMTAPGTWTRPWTFRTALLTTDDLILEYACHEGNRGLEGILRGARADERRQHEQAHAQH